MVRSEPKYTTTSRCQALELYSMYQKAVKCKADVCVSGSDPVLLDPEVDPEIKKGPY
jgi:hypothetical protein